MSRYLLARDHFVWCLRRISLFITHGLTEILSPTILGQKGIGFKSVFRVSDCPEVHSNGYHIRFDAKSGPIGYILPQWIEEKCPDDDTSEHEDDGLEDMGEGDSDKVTDCVEGEFDR